MGWTIAAIVLAIICVALMAQAIKRNDLMDEQMEILKRQDRTIEMCLRAWQVLTFVPKMKLMFENDGVTLIAHHPDPEEQAKGQKAIDELKRVMDELKDLREERV